MVAWNFGTEQGDRREGRAGDEEGREGEGRGRGEKPWLQEGHESTIKHMRHPHPKDVHFLWRRAVSAVLAGAFLVLARGLTPKATLVSSETGEGSRSQSQRSRLLRSFQEAWERVLAVCDTPESDAKAQSFVQLGEHEHVCVF